MKYMLMMYFEENTALTQEQRERCYVESTAFANKLHEQGKFLGAAPLQPTSTATSLRLENGKRVLTDGPFEAEAGGRGGGLERGGAEEFALFVELVGEGGGFDVAAFALLLGEGGVFFEVHHEHVFHGFS